MTVNIIIIIIENGYASNYLQGINWWFRLRWGKHIYIVLII